MTPPTAFAKMRANRAKAQLLVQRAIEERCRREHVQVLRAGMESASPKRDPLRYMFLPSWFP